MLDFAFYLSLIAVVISSILFGMHIGAAMERDKQRKEDS